MFLTQIYDEMNFIWLPSATASNLNHTTSWPQKTSTWLP
jgi:hypothetical protein